MGGDQSISQKGEKLSLEENEFIQINNNKRNASNGLQT